MNVAKVIFLSFLLVTSFGLLVVAVPEGHERSLGEAFHEILEKRRKVKANRFVRRILQGFIIDQPEDEQSDHSIDFSSAAQHYHSTGGGGAAVSDATNKRGETPDAREEPKVTSARFQISNRLSVQGLKLPRSGGRIR
jgi:hypothetical protein